MDVTDALSTVLDLLDRPANALRTGLGNAQAGQGFFQGAQQGLTGERHTQGKDLVGGNPVMGFAADMLLDPLNFVGGLGLVGKVGKVGSKAKKIDKLSDTAHFFNKASTGMTHYDDFLTPLGQDYKLFSKGLSGGVTTMSPREYLDKTVQGFSRANDRPPRQFIPDDYSIEKIKEALGQGSKMDMPVLDYAQGFTQEGRHRATVAMQQGIPEIPVLVTHKAKPAMIQNRGREILTKARDDLGDSFLDAKTRQQYLFDNYRNTGAGYYLEHRDDTMLQSLLDELKRR